VDSKYVVVAGKTSDNQWNDVMRERIGKERTSAPHGRMLLLNCGVVGNRPLSHAVWVSEQYMSSDEVNRVHY
jgi:hypothetical protein